MQPDERGSPWAMKQADGKNEPRSKEWMHNREVKPMDGKLFRRAVLSAALGLGVWAGLARADGLLTPSPAPAQAPAAVVVNGIIYTNSGVAAAPAPVPAPAPTVAPAPCASCAAAEALEQNGQGHPVRDFLHDHKPHLCWTHFNNNSCGTAASEYAFIFGSCRTFFGEPCVSGPPGPAFPGEQPPRNICPNCARP